MTITKMVHFYEPESNWDSPIGIIGERKEDFSKPVFYGGKTNYHYKFSLELSEVISDGFATSYYDYYYQDGSWANIN